MNRRTVMTVLMQVAVEKVADIEYSERKSRNWEMILIDLVLRQVSDLILFLFFYFLNFMLG